jgi:DNA-binding transcriptional LysR family regulator
MDKFGALRAFVTVVEAGGFAAAARLLGVSRSAVNRLVIALEDDLGAQLLNRTTRRVAPTATGNAFYQRAKTVLDGLEEAERGVGEVQREAKGEMRINAPMSFGTLHLAPAVAEFMVRYPGVRIQLELNDRFVDVIEEGFDLTVRIWEPREDANLVDHRIAPVRRVLCAAPAFLKQQGMPAHPRQLERLPCLHYGNLATGHRWRLLGADGGHSIQVAGVLCSNNGEVLRDAAVNGLGIALLPTFIAGAELQAGRLVTILDGYRPPDLTLCVIYPLSRHLSAKIRLFTDFLTGRFGGRPYWDLVH